MSPLLRKSKISFDAAELLHEECLYSSVAHCSYYSCFQMCKHIWLYEMNETEDALEQLIQSSFKNRVGPTGSHNVLLNQVVGSYIKSNNHADFRVINRGISQLKKLRETADYDDEKFTSIDSENSIKLLREVNNILKKHI